MNKAIETVKKNGKLNVRGEKRSVKPMVVNGNAHGLSISDT